MGCNEKSTMLEKVQCFMMPGTKPPECEIDGKFKSNQCIHVSDHHKFCWCLNSAGDFMEDTITDMTQNGASLNCEIPPICKAQYDKVVLKLKSTPQKDVYIPQCDDDNSFKPRQCQGTKCWCVDAFGKEKENTVHSITKKNNCKMISCEEKLKK